MANPAAITLRALASATAGAETAAEDIGEGRSALDITLRVTACSGNFSCALQTSPNGVDGWRTVRSFGTVNAAATPQRMVVDQLERYCRLAFTVTTSVTFGVEGEAHQLYAEHRHLRMKVSATVLDRADQEDENLRPDFLIAATAEMEDALAPQRGAVAMPLTTVPRIICDKTACIAAGFLLDRMGWVGGGVDDVLKDAYAAALEWTERVRTRKVLPFGTVPDPEPAVHTSDLTDTTSALSQTVMPSRWTDWGDFG